MAKAAKTDSAVPEAAQGGGTDVVLSDAAGAAVEGADADVAAQDIAIAPAAPVQRFVRARVLAYCNLGAPDDVIDVEADLADTLGDVIDTDPAAVEYALSQRA